MTNPNLPAPSASQVPAHLAFLTQHNIGAHAIGGISAGLAIHQISVKSSRWRLQDPQGQEVVVPHHHLDVIIVGANPYQSKIWYAKSYNPADVDSQAPDCYSDNGIGASSRAKSPQSKTCADCPHNVWGSKITPSGAQTKACADAKKLAVILAENPTGPVYLLRVPAASLKNLYSFVESLSNRGIPLPGVVVRLEFDSQADYPKINFTPASWASEEQSKAVQDVIDTDEVNLLTNLQDKPVDPAKALPAPAIAGTTAAPFVGPAATASPGAFAPPPVAAPLPPVTTAPTSVPPQPTAAPVNPFGLASPPIAPVAPAAASPAPLPPVPPAAAAPLPPVGQPVSDPMLATAPATPTKRRSRKKSTDAAVLPAQPAAPAPLSPVPPAAAAPLPPVGQPVEAAPGSFFAGLKAKQDVPTQQPAAAAVQTAPAPSNPELDTLLAQAMKV